MSEKHGASPSSPSLAGDDLQGGFSREAVYHDTDVFGNEEDHDVGFNVFRLRNANYTLVSM